MMIKVLDFIGLAMQENTQCRQLQENLLSYAPFRFDFVPLSVILFQL